jgi:hypothetical protein
VGDGSNLTTKLRRTTSQHLVLRVPCCGVRVPARARAAAYAFLPAPVLLRAVWMKTMVAPALRVAVAASLLAALFGGPTSASAAPSTILSPAPAGYPRMTMMATPNGSSVALASFERPEGSTRRIVVYGRTTVVPEVFAQLGVAAEVPNATPDVDLANGYLLQLPNGTLLCAFRHHDGNGASRVFRIQVSASHDYGVTWALLSTVAQGPIGVWEPYLFRLTTDDNSTVRVAYSAELTNGGEQDVVVQVSGDGGATWGAVSSRIHTPGSRNGMPAIIELLDHSLLAVFEGFWTGVWGDFTVNSARSFDGGTTWPEREMIHAPNSSSSPGGSSFDAGSPQAALCPVTGKIVVVYMSNEPTNVSTADSAVSSWPDGAHAAVQSAHLNYTNVTAPLDWSLSPPAVIPTETPTIYWPSFFLDPDSPLGEGEGDEEGEEGARRRRRLQVNYAMRIAYQGADGSAAVTDATVCID